MKRFSKIFLSILAIIFAGYHIMPIGVIGLDLANAALAKTKASPEVTQFSQCQPQQMNFLTYSSPLEGEPYRVLNQPKFMKAITTGDGLNTPNLVPNNKFATVSLEDQNIPDSWRTNQLGENTAVFNFKKPQFGLDGGLHVRITNFKNGDAKWESEPVAVLPSQLYRISDEYMSDTYTSVTVAIIKLDESVEYIQLGRLEPTKTKRLYEVDFYTPTNTKAIRVLHAIKSNGYLETTNYKIIKQEPAHLDRPLVSLTFDDGWRSVYTDGKPVLDKYGYNSTQFIATGYIGDESYMTDEQILDFYRSGNEIGSHTIHHADLSEVSQSQRELEIVKSKTDLERLVGQVYNFASPYGINDDLIRTDILRCFQTHRSTDAGFNDRNLDISHLRVQNVDKNTSIEQYQQWLAQAKKDNLWLIFVYHQVDNGPSEYAVTSAQLDSQLAEIKKSQIEVKTISGALAEVMPQSRYAVY